MDTLPPSWRNRKKFYNLKESSQEVYKKYSYKILQFVQVSQNYSTYIEEKHNNDEKNIQKLFGIPSQSYNMNLTEFTNTIYTNEITKYVQEDNLNIFK